jgi:two-component system cell cycle response regulator
MRKTILVIDDSVPLHKLIRAQLEPDDLRLKSAHDGESGLAAAAKFRPSLILLDVDLPRLDGFEVCKRLKANSITSDIPVVFLTANPMVAEKVKAFGLGAADYITKPFKAVEFRARVRAALRVRSDTEAIAMIDGLTGLWNRSYLDLHFKGQLSQAKRASLPLGCVVARIDHYAALAARCGEAAALDTVRQVARIISSQCREEDMVCRYDESKFVFLVIGANRAAAALLAERLRASVERQMATLGAADTRITCSFGVADTFVAEDENLISRADEALAHTRQKAGNGVTIAEGSDGRLHAAA